MSEGQPHDEKLGNAEETRALIHQLAIRCGKPPEEIEEELEKSRSEKTRKEQYSNENGARMNTELQIADKPGIASVMNVIGWLSILGGFLLWLFMLEVFGSGAFVWLFSGIISGMLFFACGAALTYLHATFSYTEAIALKLYEATAESDPTEPVE